MLMSDLLCIYNSTVFMILIYYKNSIDRGMFEAVGRRGVDDADARALLGHPVLLVPRRPAAGKRPRAA